MVKDNFLRRKYMYNFGSIHQFPVYLQNKDLLPILENNLFKSMKFSASGMFQ